MTDAELELEQVLLAAKLQAGVYYRKKFGASYEMNFENTAFFDGFLTCYNSMKEEGDGSGSND